MKNTDGIPRRAILVMAAILVSVILGAQAGTRSTHQIFAPTNPLALFTKNLSNSDRILANAKSTSDGSTKVRVSSSTSARVFSQDNATLVHRSGIISSDETWAGDKTYYIENAIDITQGATLTLSPGTTVKVAKGQTAFIVRSGSTLVSSGTADDPVTITSAFDSTDRTTPDFGPEAGDYKTGIVAGREAAVRLSGTTILFADTGLISYGQASLHNVQISDTTTGIEVNDGTALLDGTTISHSIRGLDVGGGLVTYRGAMSFITDMAIRACVWGSDACSVDASYTNWSSVDGPAGIVCGQVQTLPWKFNGAIMSSQNLFAANCDGNPSPDMLARTSIDNFQQRRTSRATDCTNGLEDACGADSAAFACLNTALSGALSSAPFTFPIVDGSGNGMDTFFGGLQASAQAYLVGQATERPDAVDAVSHAYIGYAKNVFGATTAAFNSCAP